MLQTKQPYVVGVNNFWKQHVIKLAQDLGENCLFVNNWQNSIFALQLSMFCLNHWNALWFCNIHEPQKNCNSPFLITVAFGCCNGL